MTVRVLREELQIKAIKELNENPERTKEDLQYLREWLRKQPHLHIREEDQDLITFLRGCKWSLQRTKEKIDYFYTIRTWLPEWFMNTDPLCPELQTILNAEMLFALPKLKDFTEPRTLMLIYSDTHVEVTPSLLCKLFFMSLDVLLHEDDDFVISGFKLLVDYKKVTSNFILQITPALLKKFIICYQNAYPIRMKGILGINVPRPIEMLYNTCKPLLSGKLRNRISISSKNNSEKILSEFKEILPNEYGGNNGPFKMMAGNIHRINSNINGDLIIDIAEEWRYKIESYRKRFLEDGNYLSNEMLRPGEPKTYDEELGIAGSFRRLVID